MQELTCLPFSSCQPEFSDPNPSMQSVVYHFLAQTIGRNLPTTAHKRSVI
jgi:hypothetical protein